MINNKRSAKATVQVQQHKKMLEDYENKTDFAQSNSEEQSRRSNSQIKQYVERDLLEEEDHVAKIVMTRGQGLADMLSMNH